MTSPNPQTLTKRVFVLGSGFSAAMGLPTLRGLFDGLMTQQERAGRQDKESVQYALVHLYPHFRLDIEVPSYPPFEEFLSLVVTAEDLPDYPPDHWYKKRISALRLLTDFMSSECKAAESNDLLTSFVSLLDYGDVIITFNWDNLIERKLQELKKELNFTERDAYAVSVLKLHGSLNWAHIPEDKALAHPETVTWLGERVCHTKDLSYFDLWDSLDLPPLIILPITSKRPPSDPFLEEIWSEAFNALVDATSVTVIGYSVPPDDFQARTLLTSVLNSPQINRRYTLVDPDPVVGARYFQQISPKLRFVQAKFGLSLFPELLSQPGDVHHGVAPDPDRDLEI